MTSTTSTPDLREASDTYSRAIHVEGHHRVALCKDGIQYLLQRQYLDRGTPQWRSLRFCVTSRALARDWTAITGTPVPDRIASLPDARAALNGSP